MKLLTQIKNIFRRVRQWIAGLFNRDRTSYPIEPTMSNDDMGSMLIHPLPELPPMHVAFMGGYNPIFIPRHRRFKGYDRENRKCTFNKNK